MEKLTKENIIDFLKQHKKFLFERFGVVEIGIFGSFAKGDYSDRSDIDIFIVMSPDTTDKLKKRLLLKEYLEKIFNRPVDICQKNAVKDYLKSIVFKDAIYV